MGLITPPATVNSSDRSQLIIPGRTGAGAPADGKLLGWVGSAAAGGPAWVPAPASGGGGGGISAWSQMGAGDYSSLTSRFGNTTCTPDAWWEYQFAAPIPEVGITSTPGQFGWGWNVAGSYHCTLQIDLGFSPNTTALPTWCEIIWTTWTGSKLDILVPLVQGASFVWGRGQAVQFSSEPAIGSHNQQSSNSLSITWDGDAHLTRSNGYAGDVLLVDVAKVG